MQFPVRLFLLIAIVGGASAAPENSSGPPHAVLTWIGNNGQPVKATFVRKDGESFVLALGNGEEKSVSRAWFSPPSLKQAEAEAAKHADRPIATVTEMVFRPIRRGRFTMGSPITESGRLINTPPVPATPAQSQNKVPVQEFEPEHRVVITKDFWLKATEVTWAEWNAVRALAAGQGYLDLALGRNGYEGDESGRHPVTEITWWDAIKWCNAKSQIENKTPVYYTSPDFKPAGILKSGMPAPHVNWNASGYRLPTEAEWEFACREGRDANTRAFYSGPISSPGITPVDHNLDPVGWYAGNSGGNTHPVGGKSPNAHGLYDMHGNVAEWCWDWANMLSPEEVRDPRGSESGPYRVFRGGSWADPARCCRAAYRGTYSPNPPSSSLVGFRPACGSDPRNHEPSDRERSRR